MNLLNVLFILMLAYPGCSSAEIFLGVFSQTLFVDTGQRKVTGVWGQLTGHYSQADENELIKTAQGIFRQTHPDILGIVELPVVIENRSILPSSAVRVPRTGMFGTEKVDKYRSFSGEAKIDLPFLSTNLSPEHPTFFMAVSAAKLLILFNGSLVADLAVSDPTVLLSELKSREVERSDTPIKLSPKIRLELGKKLGGFTGVGDIALKLKLESENRSLATVPLNIWDRYESAEFANYFFISKTRFLNPKYYSALCSSLLN